MASAYYQLLKAALKNLTTLDGQLQFLTTQTGVSDECLGQVLVHVNAQPVFDEEGDFKTQTRNEGVSVDEYAVGRGPLLEMSVQQAQARLRELEGEGPVLSEEALEKVREWEAMVGTIARVSGAERELGDALLVRDGRRHGARSYRRHPGPARTPGTGALVPVLRPARVESAR